MIKINLLPPEIAGKRKSGKVSAKPTPSAFAYLILVPVFLITFLIVFKIYSVRAESVDKLAREEKALKDNKKKLETLEKQFKDLQETYSMLNDQVEILYALDPPNRLLWSEKINMISELIPKGVYLQKLELSEKVDQVETADSKRRTVEWNNRPKKDKGPKPEVVKKPVIRQTLVMEGITFKENAGSEERLDLIVKFYQALQNFSWKNHKNEKKQFMDNFNSKITFKDIKDASVSNVDVSKFTFELSSKPFTAEAESKEVKIAAVKEEKSEKEPKDDLSKIK